MRPFFLHIILLSFCFPSLRIAQHTTLQIGFYLKLGMKDAIHELSLANLSAEDEKDFWADQKSFEVLLKREDPIGYQSYLNGKYSVYRKHQIHCGERCIHSDEFERHIAYYLIHGESSLPSEIVLALKKNKVNQRK